MRPLIFIWLWEKDLNLRPSGYEPDELPAAPSHDMRPFLIGLIVLYHILYVFANFLCMVCIHIGGGKGIRTPAPLSWPLGFQDRPLQPDLGIPPFIGACGRNWTGTRVYSRRILSPVRLPIPPHKQKWCLVCDSNAWPFD